MRGRGSFAVLVGVLAVAVAGAGCGSDSGGGSASAEPSISRAEFIKQADAICGKGEAELKADLVTFLQEHINQKKATPAIYDALIETVIAPNISTEVAHLRELGIPAGDEAQVEALLTAREESIALTEKDPAAIFQDSDKVFAKSSTMAREYGLKVCGAR